jgi:hypothetical protein
MVVARFTGQGTNDGPLGPFPATGKEWTLPICELWHFDADGRVVGGGIYYAITLEHCPFWREELAEELPFGAFATA